MSEEMSEVTGTSQESQVVGVGEATGSTFDNSGDPMPEGGEQKAE